MKLIFRIVFLSVVFTLSIQSSVFSKNNIEKFAKEYAKQFIEALKTNDSTKLQTLFPTEKELRQHISDASTEKQDRFKEWNKEFSYFISSYDDILLPQFYKSYSFIEDIYPVIPIENIKFVSNSVNDTADAIQHQDFFSTHKIDITFSIEADGYKKMQFQFPTYALLTDNRFAVVEFMIDPLIFEIPTKNLKIYAKNILDALINNSLDFYYKKLRPPFEAYKWNYENRLNKDSREWCLKNLTDCEIDLTTYNDEAVKYFDDDFKENVKSFEYYINVDSIKNYKYIDCFVINIISPDLTTTLAVASKFSVTFLNGDFQEYNLYSYVLQERDNYFYGLGDEIEIEKIEKPDEYVKVEIPQGDQVKIITEKDTYIGMFGEDSKDCPEAKSNRTNLKIASDLNDYSKSVEYFDKLIECPFGLTYRDMVGALATVGDAYLHFFTDTSNIRTKTFEKKYDNNHRYLIDAINVFTEAYTLIDESNYLKYGSKNRSLDRQHILAVSIAFNYATSLAENKQMDSAMAYYEAVADGAEHVVKDGIENIDAIEALSGYYSGYNYFNQENYQMADIYFSKSVPLDENYLGDSKEQFSNKINLDESTTLIIYKNLGISCFNESVSSYESAELFEDPDDFLEALEFAKKSVLCFKLSLILDPDDKQAMGNLQGAKGAIEQISSKIK